MSAGRILRHEVPVDDNWHELELAGEIVHVASRRTGVVEFWSHEGAPTRRRSFIVVGTGHALPPGEMTHRGTTFDVATPHLVWHLIEGGAS